MMETVYRISSTTGDGVRVEPVEDNRVAIGPKDITLMPWTFLTPTEARELADALVKVAEAVEPREGN